MRFESWVHPAGVVMGSRWLVVPTPTAESLLRLRGRASLCMPSRAVLVSVSSARHLPSWCLLWLYSKDEWSDIRTDRQVKRPAESRRFRTAVNQPKPHRDSNAPVQARVHFCIQWTDLHMYNFSVCVQPSVEKQLEKYISLRVQCFVQLEIFFLPEQLEERKTFQWEILSTRTSQTTLWATLLDSEKLQWFMSLSCVL